MKFCLTIIRSILGLGLFFQCLAPVFADTPNIPNCDELLVQLKQAEKADLQSELRADIHNLKELLVADKTKNLAYQNPFIMMNAAQRVLAIIEEMGYEEKSYFGTDGNIRVPKVFSQPTFMNDFRAIMGHEFALTRIRSQIVRAIHDDTNVITIDGPHGTGKSEILSVLGAALKNYTKLDPKGHFYTFEFVGLDEIVGLQGQLPRVGGKSVSSWTPAAPENVVALLPESYQDWLKGFTDEVVRERTDSGAKPFTKLMPKSQAVRDAIVAHYAKGRVPTEAEVVEYLAKHVVVKRAVLGEGSNLAKLDAQGRDWKPSELFMKENGIISQSLGQSSPWAWEEGLFLRAANSMAYVDELLRNADSLQDKLLTLFQEHKVGHGGAPVVSVDLLIFSATNTANLRDVLSDAKGEARIDRLMRFLFGYTPEPQVIQPTLALMKRGELYALNLSDQDEKLKRVFPETRDEESLLLKLWPRAELGQPVKRPHGEYVFYIGDGRNKILVSPHVFEFVANLVSASRQVTDVEKARAARNMSVIDEDIFKDPIQRIKFFNGEKPEVNEEMAKELAQITRLLGEGHDGMSTRAVNRWLNSAISRAEQPGRENTLTLEDLMVALEDTLGDREVISDEQRLNYELLSLRVYHELVLPAVERDIHGVMDIYRSTEVARLYEEFVQSELALNQPEGNQTVELPNGDVKPIDIGLLHDVEHTYTRQTGKPWSVDFIRRFSSLGGQVLTESGVSVHPDIMEAVSEVYAKKMVSNLSFMESMMRSKESPDEFSTSDLSAYQLFEQQMWNQFGYNRRALHSALNALRARELAMKKAQEAAEAEAKAAASGANTP